MKQKLLETTTLVNETKQTRCEKIQRIFIGCSEDRPRTVYKITISW